MNKKLIFLSGSPILDQKAGIHTGRLSGISNHHVPAYLKTNQLPSFETNCIEDWEEKLDKIIDGILKDLSNKTFNHDNPDFHFMSQAYEIVKGWFEKKTRNDVGYIDDFYSSITKKVQVIWYQIEELISFEDEEVINECKKILLEYL